MQFASDNWSGAAPEIVEAIARQAAGHADAYGTSALDRAVEDRFNALFEREVAVFFVGTGTACNALALAAVAKPGGAIFCHRESHIVEDECGAVEFHTSGARLMQLDGTLGKIAPAELEDALRRFQPGFVHAGQPIALSVTQATEVGTIYRDAELDLLCSLARGSGIPVHMDGARFANALVRLGRTPAEMTWKRGVDILSFGATKNGCVSAEALVFFDPQMASELPFLRKRAGHLFSKTRFIAAQFEAHLAGDLWLDLARHANRMAERLRQGLAATDKARLAWTSETNETFALLDRKAAERARAAGAVFLDWNRPHGLKLDFGENEILVRLVTNFQTGEDEIDRFLEIFGA
ncbi:low specificity L-threonine aldolase [Afifella sp. IM 167]|uniref:threonine aldolase family protein n=1 Tax=Afifella sp. IM 167 TaxID=2033586 RepID=UPI001CCD8BE6|nr:low specificity L-threonine aldolase [Afifella sp. IM 167]MBZ8132732.1 low specificity L-threonine aldolase [Afifella sp. IM 167]